MKRFILLLLVGLLSIQLIAQESVTVTANSEDIANNLDLNLVASLFGQAADVEEFETLLNNPDSTFSNLDLNGDGQVDYLRVVESSDGNRRLVIIQAVLAKDIFQDVASIYLEKDESTNEVSAQVIGDQFIYGDNYVIIPVYLRRPVIYSWLWSSIYMPYCSPWYWDHYPFYWRHWHRLTCHDYWRRCYHWHHHHHYCSFHHHHHPDRGYHDMYHRSGVGRQDYATHHPDQSYERRHGDSGVYRRGGAPNTVNESVRSRKSSDDQFGSSNVRSRSQSSDVSSRTSNSRTSVSSVRSTGGQQTRSTSRTAATTSRTSTSSGRPTGGQSTRSTSVSRSTGGQTSGHRITTSRGSASSRTSSASISRSSGGGPRSSGGSYRGPSSSSHRSTGSSRSSGNRSSSSSSGRSRH